MGSYDPPRFRVAEIHDPPDAPEEDLAEAIAEACCLWWCSPWGQQQARYVYRPILVLPPHPPGAGRAPLLRLLLVLEEEVPPGSGRPDPGGLY